MWIRNSGSSVWGARLGASSAGCLDVPHGAGQVPPGRALAEVPRGKDQGAQVDALPAEWFREHVAVVWRLVARLGVPAHGVDDVVQETFITANRRRADIAAGQERAFLLSTAVRLASNQRQRAHVRREVSADLDFDQQPSLEPDAEQLLIEKRWRELLERVLASLTDAHRTVFVLFELEGCSVPEIAELLALPLGTVSSRLQRARARFSELATELQLHVERQRR